MTMPIQSTNWLNDWLERQHTQLRPIGLPCNEELVAAAIEWFPSIHLHLFMAENIIGIIAVQANHTINEFLNVVKVIKNTKQRFNYHPFKFNFTSELIIETYEISAFKMKFDKKNLVLLTNNDMNIWNFVNGNHFAISPQDKIVNESNRIR